MRVTFNVTGPLIWLDENGQPTGYFDVFDYITLCKEHYEKAGIGASYIEGCSADAVPLTTPFRGASAGVRPAGAGRRRSARPARCRST
jgi:hypothetical protein